MPELLLVPAHHRAREIPQVQAALLQTLAELKAKLNWWEIAVSSYGGPHNIDNNRLAEIVELYTDEDGQNLPYPPAMQKLIQQRLRYPRWNKGPKRTRRSLVYRLTILMAYMEAHDRRAKFIARGMDKYDAQFRAAKWASKDLASIFNIYIKPDTIENRMSDKTKHSKFQI